MLMEIEQRTQAWHDWRDGKDLPDRMSRIMASTIASIVGKNPFRSASQLYADLRGEGKPVQVNHAMQAGIDYEDEAREALERLFERSFKPACAQMDDNPTFGASLDGIDSVGSLLAEIKVPGEKGLRLAQAGEVPENYLLQMQWQMACSGATQGAYWAYDHGGKIGEKRSGYLVAVGRDEATIATLKLRAAAFREAVVTGAPLAGVEVALRALPVARLMREHMAITTQLDAARAQLLEALREADVSEARTAGLTISISAPGTSVSWSSVAKELSPSDELIARHTKPTSGSMRCAFAKA